MKYRRKKHGRFIVILESILDCLPFSRFIRSVLIGFLVVVSSQAVLWAAIPAGERAGLIALYNSTGGDQWVNDTGWKTPPLHTDGFAMPGTESTWFGISVSGDHVIGIHLRNNQLTGDISPGFGNLTGLEVVDLYSNKISGIPTEIGNLKALKTFFLGDNEISSLPAGIGGLTNLIDLYLDSNRIPGLPPEIGNLGNLDYLYLSNNDLSGSFPGELYNLKLSVLDLGNNRLSGSIPSWISEVVSTEVYLSFNQFSGTIPPGLGSLYFIRLDHNQLSGAIPPELTDVRGGIYLNSNQLSGNPPIGFLEWDRYSERELDIHYNSLHTGNEALSTNIDNFCPGWNNTQTIAPENLKAVAASASSIMVSWTPILYTADPGGYLVYYSTSAEGPWAYAGITDDKSASSFTVTGLNPNTEYYFFVKTRTDPHSNNSNTVTSEASAVVSAVTPGSGVTYSLTVQSSPDTGITISVSPDDKNNNGNGTTNFTRVYNKGSIVTLTAAAAFNGKEFSKWVIDGNQSTNSTVQVIMDSSHTAIAQYVIQGPPAITLNRTDLHFGVKLPMGETMQSDTQTLLVANSGGGTLQWSAVPTASWIEVNPASGTGPGEVLVSVDAAGLSQGTYTGAITVSDSAAVNSPQTVNVTLKVFQDTAAPFGSFDTPVDGAEVQGSIAVTGWVLDDIGIDSVKIYRGENNTLVYIGEAILVEGARPDVETAYPDYPNSYKAGWGYMMLTNFLPDQGNGTFTLYAQAEDKEGQTVTLGTKTITCDNAHAVEPFGAIDTPVPGEIASGSNYFNWGWALTPSPNTIPIDGSTILVWVDGVPLGHPVYNQYRQDVAALFPGYNNSSGAGGWFGLDTTAYENGVHTISWSVMDNAGNIDGIGSRYFTIQNLAGSTMQEKGNEASVRRTIKSFDQTFSKVWPPAGLPEALFLKKGYNPDNELETLYADGNGHYTIEIKELERLIIYLEDLDTSSDSGYYQGYLVNGDPLKPLPIGSTLDRSRGVFYWQPGPGFLGTFRLVFIKTDQEGNIIGKDVRVNVIPKFGPARMPVR
jgi:hypothetical protein